MPPPPACLLELHPHITVHHPITVPVPGTPAANPIVGDGDTLTAAQGPHSLLSLIRKFPTIPPFLPNLGGILALVKIPTCHPPLSHSWHRMGEGLPFKRGGRGGGILFFVRGVYDGESGSVQFNGRLTSPTRLQSGLGGGHSPPIFFRGGGAWKVANRPKLSCFSSA